MKTGARSGEAEPIDLNFLTSYLPIGRTYIDMPKKSLLLSAAHYLGMSLLVACSPENGTLPDTQIDSGTVDTNSDTDTEGDTDSDTETSTQQDDTDSYTGADFDTDSYTDTDSYLNQDPPVCVKYVNNSLSDFTGHDGSSWQLAFEHVQEGINAAYAGGCEVWVAQGVYLPTETSSGDLDPADPSTKVITMKQGVDLYGGFQGMETSRNQRVPQAHTTTLSGAGEIADFVGDNNYNIVKGANSVILSGFTISDAACWDCGSNGAMLNLNVSLVVTNCTFTRNTTDFKSAAMNNSGSNVVVINTEFIDNHTFFGGSAITNYSSSTLIVGCNFDHNTAHDLWSVPDPWGPWETNTPEGGAIYSRNSAMNVVRTNFIDNHATNGGAIFLYNQNSNTSPGIPIGIYGSEFKSNSVSYKGGAVFGHLHSRIDLFNNVFEENESEHFGGALYLDSSSHPIVINSVFDSNMAEEEGGALYITSTATVIGSTFVDNSAELGGAIKSQEHGWKVRNSIFWGNSSSLSLFAINAPLGLNITYSNIEGGCTTVDKCTTSDEGNMDKDPVFTDDSFHIGSGSPCIDTGNGTYAPATDLEGNPRHDAPTAQNVFDCNLSSNPNCVNYADMGAQEYQGP